MERRKRSWLARRDKVELFEQIRREYEFGVGTIAGVSRKLGVHRRRVREALTSAVPSQSKPQQRRLRKLGAALRAKSRGLLAMILASWRTFFDSLLTSGYLPNAKPKGPTLSAPLGNPCAGG
jgi:hypothetical protein